MQGEVVMSDRREAIDYGHLHLGFWFRHAVTVDDDGLAFAGRRHAWTEIAGVDCTPPGLFLLVGYPSGKPKATIRFRDGTMLRLDGMSFTKRGERPRAGFWSSRSRAFDDFVALVQLRKATR